MNHAKSQKSSGGHAEFELKMSGTDPKKALRLTDDTFFDAFSYFSQNRSTFKFIICAISASYLCIKGKNYKSRTSETTELTISASRIVDLNSLLHLIFR